jgi:hypothetical protein
MKRAERLAAIRARLQKSKPAVVQNPRGINATAHPDEAMPIRKIDRVRTSGVLLRGSWGPINRPRGLRYGWVHEPDLNSGTTFKVSERQGQHALTRIAEKWRDLKKGS